MPAFNTNGNTFNVRHITRVSEPKTMNQNMDVATFAIFNADGQKFETRYATLDEAKVAHSALAALIDNV